jgi:hypothetical protein
MVPSTSVCLAVGEYSQGAFLLTMAGSTWTGRRAPLPANAEPAGTASLEAVACPATSACVATGYFFNATGETFGLLVTGSGDTWTAGEAPLPSNAITTNQPAGLSSTEWLVTGPS